MKLFSCINSKCKILGISIFKFRNTKKGVLFYLFGIPVCVCNKKISKIVSKVEKNKDFDMREMDEEIASYVSDDISLKTESNSKKIAYLATELYDMGGHSKCIRDLVKSLDGIYEQKLFLTKKTRELNVISFLKKYLDIFDININLIKIKEQSKFLADAIIQYAPKALLVYIHPNDILGAGVISLIKKNTNIKIIYSNHASHRPNLGMTFADIILEGMPTTVKITNEKRHLYNTIISGLQSLNKDETIYYSKDDLDNLKKEIGIEKKDYYITMSGGNAYKFFEQNTSSKYFEMIKRILQRESHLYHIIITELNSEQSVIVNDIFNNTEERERLIFLPYQKEFDKYFQCADVFIDSFPVSSALTQIDLMRNKVASVVKINKEIPEYSFHEYQMPNYPYMFENVNDMENAVLELLHNKNKRQEIIEKNYQFWLNTYESDVKRDMIIKIIEGM